METFKDRAEMVSNTTAETVALFLRSICVSGASYVRRQLVPAKQQRSRRRRLRRLRQQRRAAWWRL